MIKPWETVSSKPVADFRIFKIRSDTKTSPRTGKPYDFYILESVDWVNVVAITTDQRMVMIEQFRHGSNTVELEIPGGMMDPGETSPLEAGLRELKEETGYVGSGGRLIGKIFSNPAILNNVTHTLLVTNCELRHAIQLDSGEDLAVKLVPLGEIPDLIRSGRIGHSLVVVALYHYELWQRQKGG